jgi:hypothetical protein
MKYLRKFNETTSSLIDSIKKVEVSKLLELGFKVEYKEAKNNGIIVEITKFGTNPSDKYMDLFKRRFSEDKIKELFKEPTNLMFEWGEIKNEFLDYCKKIDSLFNIFEIKVGDSYDNFTDLIEDDEDDDLYDDLDLDCIEISIKNKKIKEEIQELCDTHFAYLYDEGFSVEIHDGYDYLTITLGKQDHFEYSSIEDHFIPFIKTISRRYNLFRQIYFNVPKKSDVKCTIDEIINDSVKGTCKSISFLIYY